MCEGEVCECIMFEGISKMFRIFLMCSSRAGGNFLKNSITQGNCHTEGLTAVLVIRSEAICQSAASILKQHIKGDRVLDHESLNGEVMLHWNTPPLQQVLLLCCTNRTNCCHVFLLLFCVKLSWSERARKNSFGKFLIFSEDSAPLYLVLHNFQRTVIQQDYLLIMR